MPLYFHCCTESKKKLAKRNTYICGYDIHTQHSDLNTCNVACSTQGIKRLNYKAVTFHLVSAAVSIQPQPTPLQW